MLQLILTIDPDPLLETGFVLFESKTALGSMETPLAIASLLHHQAEAGLRSDASVRTAVRDLLRASGFKPTGRSKPSSEYLHKASEEGRLSPINTVVDLCNAASLHSALPISVVDLDRVVPPLRIGVATEGASYIFNASGQVIDVGKLLCLHDAEGPCANAVKDAQRTKTGAGTTRALAIVWGTKTAVGQTSATTSWMVERARQTELDASILHL